MMEENAAHQDDSSQSQAQSGSRLSSKEVERISTGVQTPFGESQISPVPSRSRRFPHIKVLVIGLLVLVVFLSSIGIYALERPSAPGGSATIRITPASQQLSKTYTIDTTPDSGDPTLNPIKVRTIRFTTPATSLTISATGKQQVPAASASGTLSLGDGTTTPIPVGDYIIFSNRSQTEVEFHVSSPVPDNTHPSVSAHAVNPGPGGNITRGDVNGWFQFPNNILIYALNQQPFSGGQNSSTITVVSQNDITNATSQLTNQLQSELPEDQAELKNQLAPSEQVLNPNTIQCQPSVQANRTPGDQQSTVTVTGTMTCSATAYTPAKLQAYGITLLEKDASAQLGSSYVLTGRIQAKLQSALEQGNTASFTLNIQGRYVFQFSSGVIAHFARLVAGQTQAHAQTLLLQQTGVAKVNIQMPEGADAPLPSLPKDIHITILPDLE